MRLIPILMYTLTANVLQVIVTLSRSSDLPMIESPIFEHVYATNHCLGGEDPWDWEEEWQREATGTCLDTMDTL